jgi:hypothetical protein
MMQIPILKSKSGIKGSAVENQRYKFLSENFAYIVIKPPCITPKKINSHPSNQRINV